MFFQEEIEELTGIHLCVNSTSLLASIWGPVIVFVDFAIKFLIPFCIFVHNYARIGRTLLQSLKENANLQERKTIE